MNKYAKKKNRKNQGRVITLVILSALLVALLLVVWKLERGGVEQIPETEPPETVSTETDAKTETEAAKTEPEETEPTETEPEETEEEFVIETEPEVDAPEASSITYEEYLALPVEVQQAYYNKFESPDAFFLWHQKAKAEHEAATAPTETVGSEDPTGSTESTGFDIDEGVEDWE